MKPKPKDPAPAHPDGEQARRLLDLLSGADATLRQEHAERHRENARRRRARRASDAAAPPILGASGAVPEGRKEAPRRRAPPRVEPEPRVYVHQGPTPSAVLNAFLHAFHGGGLVEPDVTVPDEHLLAPRLVAFVQRYWPIAVRARGDGDLAERIEEILPAADLGGDDPRDGATRFLMRRAAEVPGELGAVARDYLEHHERAGQPETDDWVAHCMAATFAGKQLRYIEHTLSPYVRDDVRRELRRLTDDTTPRARRGIAREAVLPGAGASDPDRVRKSGGR